MIVGVRSPNPQQLKMAATTASPSPTFILLFTLLSTSLFFTQSSSSTTSSTIFPDAALPTDSGYLLVNSTSGSSIFYTFYEAQQPSSSSLSQTPLLIWLQGGPGCSSMTGNFYELGPYIVTHSSESSSIQLTPNPGAWNHKFGLLFLDNPIGTGFSYAASTAEIPTDQTAVAAHLHTAIQRFLSLSPTSFLSRPIYITGESYAGKYVPAIGHYIMKQNSNPNSRRKINLAGLAIGNGLTDPVSQVQTHADTAYDSGLINSKQRIELEELQTKVVELVELEEWSSATDARNVLLRTLQNMTGLPTLYNMRRKTPYESTELVGRLLTIPAVKTALGVEDVSIVWEECSETVGEKLHADVMKSVKWMVEEILSNGGIKVLVYQGREDLRDGVVSVEAWVKRMEEGWSGLPEFMAAEREVWDVDGELAGYVQKWGKFSQVVVLDAGHFVPTDQGVRARVMIEDWVMDRGMFGDGEKRHSYDRGMIGDRRRLKRLRHLSSE